MILDKDRCCLVNAMSKSPRRPSFANTTFGCSRSASSRNASRFLYLKLKCPSMSVSTSAWRANLAAYVVVL